MFILSIVHRFEYSGVLNHAPKSGITVSGL